MAEKYSELEVAPNEHKEPIPEAVVDRAAHAPERDLSCDAPELDKKSVCRNAQPFSLTLSLSRRSGHLLSRPSESPPYLRDSWPYSL